MGLWRVALLPESEHSRARPRWLCSDGRFRLIQDQAWTVAEPQQAAQRLQHWLAVHGRDPRLLQRLQLVPVTAPATSWGQHHAAAVAAGPKP